MKVEKIVKTCDSYPSQWEGITDDNRQVYVRYRWGCLYILVGKVGDMSKFGGVCGEEVMFIDLNEEYHGVMDYAQLKKLSDGIVEFPNLEENRVDWQ